MVDEIYVKQLEAENEKLRKKIEELSLEAGCYEYVMDNLVYGEDNTFYSKHMLNIRCIVLKTHDCVYGKKIINDFLEDTKASAGSKKR